jgi:pimeloyl-ACP methyl ester carboxylesterase
MFLGALLEPMRATGELATTLSLVPFSSRLPKGDGHGVLLLPGFMATDLSMQPLARLLRSLGYEAHGWQLGRNLGPTDEVVAGLPELLDRVHMATDAPVSIVGWSLGGLYARLLAARSPDRVRAVVTLGTPVRSDVQQASNANALYQALGPFHALGLGFDEGAPLRVPVTAVHTRTDSIVHWETCLVDDAPNAENLRVIGSHSGLGWNPAVLYVVADRLAQPDGEWVPFRAPAPYRRIVTSVAAQDVPID